MNINREREDVKYVIFDTHIYRKMGRKIFLDIDTDEERKLFFENWLKAEEENNLKGCFSFMVAMELITHLENEEDPSYRDCRNAIKVLVKHCPHAYIPPPNVYFLKKYLNVELTEARNFSHKIWAILSIVGNEEPPYLDKTYQLIRFISEKLRKIENEMEAGFRKGIPSTNNDNSDDILFKDRTPINKGQRKRLQNVLQGENEYIQYQAKAFLEMIFSQIQGGDNISKEKYNKAFEDLIQNYKAPFLLIKNINEQLLQPEYKLSNKGNELTDILILFGANKNENSFLVTSEKTLIKYCEDVIIEESNYLNICRLPSMG